MKRRFILIILLIVPILNFAQTINEISITYGKSTGPASFSVLRTGFLNGASSSFLRENNSFGVRYSTSIKNKPKLKIESGIDFLTGNLKIKPAPVGDPINDASREEKITLVSVPIYLNHYFGKYFYINEGIMIDYQNTNTDTYTGFGAGIGFGIGTKFQYKKFTFYLNPKLEKHLFLSEKFGLLELGAKFGVGYNF